MLMVLFLVVVVSIAEWPDRLPVIGRLVGCGTSVVGTGRARIGRRTVREGSRGRPACWWDWPPALEFGARLPVGKRSTQEVQMKVEAGLLSRLAADRFGSGAALVSDTGTISFDECNEAASRVGSGLLACGLERGDRVGVLGFNRSWPKRGSGSRSTISCARSFTATSMPPRTSGR